MVRELNQLTDAVDTAQTDSIGGVLDDPPSDPFFSLQYGLHNTGAPIQGQPGLPNADISALKAWIGAPDGRQIVIAILDTGVSYSHPDVAPKLVPGWNCTGIGAPDDADDSWYFSHGTACAGVAAAIGDNGIGVAGVCWGARIMPVKVANAFGSSSETQAGNGMIWAADHAANVASMSLGFSDGIAFFHDSVRYAYRKGLVVVAASGNSPGAPIAFPARWPEVIAVGATNNRDELAQFTSTGPQMSVSAPGVDIYTTWDTTAEPDSYHYETGTSMSGPFVAGLACLLLSANPSLTNDQIRFVIEVTADDKGDPGWDPGFGWGRVNARAALDAIGGPSRCRADWNHDGAVTSQDLFQFLQDFFAGDADYNGQDGTTSQDLFDFLGDFFAGCG